MNLKIHCGGSLGFEPTYRWYSLHFWRDTGYLKANSLVGDQVLDIWHKRIRMATNNVKEEAVFLTAVFLFSCKIQLFLQP